MMRMYATVPIRVLPPRAIRQPRMVQCRIASQRGLLVRLRRWALATDWEGRLCRSWIDKACLGVVALSVFYFAPVLLSLFHR